MDCAAYRGFKIRLGAIKSDAVVYYMRNKHYGILMHAEYSWELCNNDLFLRHMYIFRSKFRQDVDIDNLSELFAQIIVRGHTPNAQLCAVKIGVGDIIKRAYAAGMRFGGISIMNMPNVDVLRALRETDWSWNEDMLFWLLRDYAHFGQIKDKELIDYILQSDYQVRADDFRYAVQADLLAEVELMLKLKDTSEKSNQWELGNIKISPQMSDMLKKYSYD